MNRAISRYEENKEFNIMTMLNKCALDTIKDLVFELNIYLDLGIEI